MISTLLRQLTHGVYVIGVCDESSVNAFTASWLMQVSFNPVMVALSINPQHRSWSILEQGKVFSINVLKDDQLDLAIHFGLPGTAKLESVDWRPGEVSKAPVLETTIAYCECVVETHIESGDHRLVTARVVNGKVLDETASPLLYQSAAHLDGSHALFPEKFER
ncbi:MAG TPA: flavin reductase [Crenotrichaceae bacterium]|nr:flavin reductase [Crenotrichaceae bacterium]